MQLRIATTAAWLFLLCGFMPDAAAQASPPSSRFVLEVGEHSLDAAGPWPCWSVGLVARGGRSGRSVEARLLGATRAGTLQANPPHLADLNGDRIAAGRSLAGLDLRVWISRRTAGQHDSQVLEHVAVQIGGR